MRRAFGFASFLAALLLPIGPLHAQATKTIGFEGLETGPIPTGYEDFIWTGVSDFNRWFISNGGFASLPSSGSANAFSDENTVLYLSLSGATFDLVSVFLAEIRASMSRHGASVTGMRNGEVVFSTTLDLSETAMTEYVFNWTNVDRVFFLDNGGRLLIDDLTVTTTPEPGTLVLVGTALLGLIAVRRSRSRRAAARR